MHVIIVVSLTHTFPLLCDRISSVIISVPVLLAAPLFKDGTQIHLGRPGFCVVVYKRVLQLKKGLQ